MFPLTYSLTVILCVLSTTAVGILWFICLVVVMSEAPNCIIKNTWWVVGPWSVVVTARSVDSSAAGPALHAVHATVLQPAASPSAATSVRVSSWHARPITDPLRASTSAVITNNTQQCWHRRMARDRRVWTAEPEKSSKWPAEMRRCRCCRFIRVCWWRWHRC